MLSIKFSEKIEYNPVYQKYIDLVGEEDFFEQFDNITNETVELLNSIRKERLNYKYAADKWTIKDILMHIIDTERGFSYRTIVCLRNDDKTPLYGMDEDFYAKKCECYKQRY